MNLCRNLIIKLEDAISINSWKKKSYKCNTRSSSFTSKTKFRGTYWSNTWRTKVFQTQYDSSFTHRPIMKEYLEALHERHGQQKYVLSNDSFVENLHYNFGTWNVFFPHVHEKYVHSNNLRFLTCNLSLLSYAEKRHKKLYVKFGFY